MSPNLISFSDQLEIREISSKFSQLMKKCPKYKLKLDPSINTFKLFMYIYITYVHRFGGWGGIELNLYLCVGYTHISNVYLICSITHVCMYDCSSTSTGLRTRELRIKIIKSAENTHFYKFHSSIPFFNCLVPEPKCFEDYQYDIFRKGKG